MSDMTESELAEIEARIAAASDSFESVYHLADNWADEYFCGRRSDSYQELFEEARVVRKAFDDLPRLLTAYREAREKAAAFDALQSKQTP